LLFFVALVLAFVVLIHVYLWKRLVRDPLPRGRVRAVGQGVAVVLGLLVPVTLIGVRSGHVQWLAWPGYLWLAVMFYLLVTLAVLEIPRLVIRVVWRLQSRAKAKSGAPAPVEAMKVGAALPTTRMGPAPGETPAAEAPAEKDGVERRVLLARGMAIFAGLTAVGVTGYGMTKALGPPQLNRVQMPMAKLPRALDRTRLVVVSDIHLGPLTGSHHTGRIVDVINSVNADIVCVVGDLVDGSVAELGRFATPLAGIESRQGAYFVTGNHEYYSGFEPWIEEVTKLGIRPLRNERVELGGLDLAGVNDLGGDQFGDAADFGKALGDRDTSRPVVLMAHQPLAAREAAPYGVDLQVSGHTHGGQMAPFNLLVTLQQPVVSGFGEVDGVPVYVTNGAGFWGPPVRVGAPPQVTVVELRST